MEISFASSVRHSRKVERLPPSLWFRAGAPQGCDAQVARVPGTGFAAAEQRERLEISRSTAARIRRWDIQAYGAVDAQQVVCVRTRDTPLSGRSTSPANVELRRPAR